MAKSKKIVGIGVYLGFLLISGVVFAAYWTDDFETGETVGESPINWTSTTGLNYTVKIATNTITPYAGSNMVELVDNSDSSSPSMYRSFTSTAVGSAKSYIYLPGDNIMPTMWIRQHDMTTLIRVYISSNNQNIRYFDGNGDENSGVVFQTNAWKNLEVFWDSEKGPEGHGQYDLYYDSVCIVSNIDFSLPGIPNGIRLSVGDPTATGTVYYDGVSVVPEPSALLFLGLGMSVLAAMRLRGEAT